MKILLALLLTINIASAAIVRQKVYISQVVDHPALDATRNGIIDYLAEAGLKGQLEIKIDSAQGSGILIQQIAASYLNHNPDIVVGIGTLSAQSFIKAAAAGKTNLVFTTVTDPVSAGLANEDLTNKANITGVSNFVPLEPQLEMFKKVYPKLKTIGMVYNPGEINSVSIVKSLEDTCKQMDLKLVTRTANKSSEVSQALASIIKQVDAIFISNDNTALSAITTIILLGFKEGIPVFVSDTDAVERGALAALGPNQYDIGRQTGRIIELIIKGEKPENVKIEFPSTAELYLNENAAKKLGVTFDKQLVSQAKKRIAR